ncbi:MAG TPA: branched-chain amino acid ABC transporter ATP-binding protein/permease [Desulfomonilaceae bacterium]|nr:branched-chain amino acid ABC transporter ATP-binding protein/permease [Desulfomonilaceae bacterium]
MDRSSPALKRNLGLLFTGLAIVVFPVLIPNPYYVNVANIIGLNAIIVIGLNLLIGYAGQISLGHAAFYGLGAYCSGILTVTYGVSPWMAMMAALVVTGLLALLIGIPTLKLHGHYLVMATLGFNLIVNILIIQWDGVTGGPSGFPGIPNLSIAGWPLDSDRKMYYLIWAFAFGSLLLSLNLVRSRVGRGLRAVHSSEFAANSLGVRTDRYKVKVFVLSAVYAGLAGSLYAHYLTFISPKTFDIFFSVELVTMVIVGGMGSIWGALFGTIFLTSLPNVLHFFDEYKDIFYGLILVVILIFVPEGLIVAARDRLVRNGKPSEKGGESPCGDFKDPGGKVACLARETPGAAADPILSVRNVSIRFGGIMALMDVSFDVPPGKVTALIGPNGAGKTTMINVIAGNYLPATGDISFAGQTLSGRRPYTMAAMGLTRTFQNNQIFQNMTVLENIMVGLHSRATNEFMSSLFHLPGFAGQEREIESTSWEVLKFFNLETTAYCMASSLSFGLQKRIEMARAFASHPRLMLLDEPVAGLNMTETAETAEVIKRIKLRGISVLLVEHDMNLVMGISDKVVVLNYGRKLAEGHPREIQNNAEVVDAYLGRTE